MTVDAINTRQNNFLLNEFAGGKAIVGNRPDSITKGVGKLWTAEIGRD